MNNGKCCRVVLTGGPGGGKTTAADLFRRELGEQVVVVPEAATLLYSGGFPRTGSVGVCEATQRAIYQVQINLEAAQFAHYSGRVLLCDRGTIDGSVYWPHGPMHFFSEIGSSIENELARYDGVIFFETAAVGGISIEGGNPVRIENLSEALEIDKKLKNLWSKHPNFVFVPHSNSFIKKVNNGLVELFKIVNKHYRNPADS